VSAVDPHADHSGWVVTRLLRDRAQTHAGRPFVEVRGEDAETFDQTYRRSLRTAAVLQQLGTRPGDHVLVMLPTSLDFLHVWFGTNLLGAADVDLNTNYRGGPLVHAVNLAGARTMVLHASFLPRLLEVEQELEHLQTVVVVGGEGNALPAARRLSLLTLASIDAAEEPSDTVDPSYRDIASVLFTSGTTGPAKGVLMPHAECVAIAQQSVDNLRLTEDDVFYCFHPLFHMASKFGAIVASIVAGCPIVLDTAFEPEHWLERVREHGATVSIGHGPMLEMIYAQPRRPDDHENPLRALVCAPLPSAIAVDFEERYGVRGIETWGMTEITCVTWRPYDAPLKVGSCGRAPEDAFEVQVSDLDTGEALPPGAVGEITVRPRRPWTIMQGYLGMPDKTVEAWRNLWFHTGDSGYIDDDGDLFFVDRGSDRIRRRAENIASYDIEVAACQHELVAEAAAIAVPSEFSGDDDVKLCAVVREPGTVDPEELLRHLAQRLPHHMVPRYIEFVAALPRTPTNKVQKHVLRSSGVNDATWDRKTTGVSLRDLVPSDIPTRA
jgi:crotonobetaine/carnitine-CoA ligase